MPTVQGWKAGKLDRRVDLYSRGTSVDGFGDVQDAYVLVQAGVWAHKKEKARKEKFEADHDIEKLQVMFLIRWRASLPDVTHRVVYEGRNYDVYSVIEVGRRQYLELHTVLEPRQ